MDDRNSSQDLTGDLNGTQKAEKVEEKSQVIDSIIADIKTLSEKKSELSSAKNANKVLENDIEESYQRNKSLDLANFSIEHLRKFKQNLELQIQLTDKEMEKEVAKKAELEAQLESLEWEQGVLGEIPDENTLDSEIKSLMERLGIKDE